MLGTRSSGRNTPAQNRQNLVSFLEIHWAGYIPMSPLGRYHPWVRLHLKDSGRVNSGVCGSGIAYCTRHEMTVYQRQTLATWVHLSRLTDTVRSGLAHLLLRWALSVKARNYMARVIVRKHTSARSVLIIRVHNKRDGRSLVGGRSLYPVSQASGAGRGVCRGCDTPTIYVVDIDMCIPLEKYNT